LARRNTPLYRCRINTRRTGICTGRWSDRPPLDAQAAAYQPRCAASDVTAPPDNSLFRQPKFPAFAGAGNSEFARNLLEFGLNLRPEQPGNGEFAQFPVKFPVREFADLPRRSLQSI
jgi:hypothetical protein